ncbi:hypothetical protein O6H91_Y027300 [Diphasiastrum complanatum]|nr:hypothetical protein O6H91_Y027300 [Diphasiastrum complanatum]
MLLHMGLTNRLWLTHQAVCVFCLRSRSWFCSRCGASFDVEIASANFEGKRLLERHRLVNTALAEELKQIHALSISKALTPQQWKDQQPSPA